MAVQTTSVTDVTTQAATSSSLFNAFLLSALLGGGAGVLNVNTLAGLLALTGRANLAVAIPFSLTGSVLGQPVLSVLPNTAGSASNAALAALLGLPGLALASAAVPTSSGLLSTLALLSLLGTSPSCA